ncbi:prolipoprotein diacylglyceryl transferase [Galactobacter caseinivorans]|uniref:prolipoprotein diacylglyceryl transferase n=1 Tax=Galactobacter caseinivorans TaxID=2676123 RepID=UPI0018F4DF19|nr:prolipoprotein diacylglyceryl transferase [Galactobacter caseinivorans]
MSLPIAAAVLPLSIPSPPQEMARFSLGPLTIHMYALCILLGIVVALWLTVRRWRARGGESDVIWDVAIWAIPFGIIGGRLYHVVSSPDAYFGPGYDGTGDPIKILYIWNGGLGIWGAVALGAVGAWIGTRRAGVRLSAFADAAAPGLLLAQAIGRLGNWFNQELFGSPTTLPWGLQIDPTSPNFPPGLPADTLFHPTFLYEMLWNLAGVAALLLLDRRLKLRFGQLVWLYVVIYTAGRTWIEALRIDEAQMITIGGIEQRLNVWTSLLLFVLAVVILTFCAVRARRMDQADFMYLPGHGPAELEEAGDGDQADTLPDAAGSAPGATPGRASTTDTGTVTAAGTATTTLPTASESAVPTAAAQTRARRKAGPRHAPEAAASSTEPATAEDSPYPTAEDLADDSGAVTTHDDGSIDGQQRDS